MTDSNRRLSVCKAALARFHTKSPIAKPLFYRHFTQNKFTLMQTGNHQAFLPILLFISLLRIRFICSPFSITKEIQKFGRIEPLELNV